MGFVCIIVHQVYLPDKFDKSDTFIICPRFRVKNAKLLLPLKKWTLVNFSTRTPYNLRRLIVQTLKRIVRHSIIKFFNGDSNKSFKKFLQKTNYDEVEHKIRFYSKSTKIVLLVLFMKTVFGQYWTIGHAL